MGMLKEFKDFAMRGNVLDMAIGIIIGASFGKIVTIKSGTYLVIEQALTPHFRQHARSGGASPIRPVAKGLVRTAGGRVRGNGAILRDDHAERGAGGRSTDRHAGSHCHLRLAVTSFADA